MQTLFANYGSVTAITPSDTTVVFCRAIYVGGAGDVAVRTVDGATTATFKAPPVGTVLPVAIDGGHVMAATTATLLLALA